MRTTLIVVGGIFILAAMAVSMFMLGAIAHGPTAAKFEPYAQVLVASLFTLPIAWVCGYLFSKREIADQNRPNVVRQWVSLPFYAVTLHGFVWMICAALGLR